MDFPDGSWCVCVAVNTDCLLHMALYDENLLKNPFYVALEKQRPDLCSRVAEVHGVVSLRRCRSRRVQTKGGPVQMLRLCSAGVGLSAGSGSVLQQSGGQQLPRLPV